MQPIMDRSVDGQVGEATPVLLDRVSRARVDDHGQCLVLWIGDGKESLPLAINKNDSRFLFSVLLKMSKLEPEFLGGGDA